MEEHLITRTVDDVGNIRYRYQGKLHRLDGPAVIYKNGSKAWYQYGKRHRKDGPAVFAQGISYEYWLRGQPLEPGSAAYIIIQEKERRKHAQYKP